MAAPDEARKSRVLVVEDEPKVARALREGFEAEGYEVLVAGTGEEGLFLASTRPLDVIVLDIMLPGRDGLEILSSLRGTGFEVPVLMLTARDALPSPRVGRRSRTSSTSTSHACAGRSIRTGASS